MNKKKFNWCGSHKKICLKKYEPLILSKEIHVRCNIAMTDYKKKCKPKNKK